MSESNLTLIFTFLALVIAILAFIFGEQMPRYRWPLGVLFLLVATALGLLYLQNAGDDIFPKNSTSEPVASMGITSTAPSIEPTSPSQNTKTQYEGWVLCWHGKFQHEYIIAYPEEQLAGGMALDMMMKKPWDNQNEYLANDSLKMCYYDGAWLGVNYPVWYPYVSFMQLDSNSFTMCENGPTCQGKKWTLTGSEMPPIAIQELLRQPSGAGIQLLGDIPSQQISQGEQPSIASQQNEFLLPNGDSPSPEALASLVGGEAIYWTKRSDVVWGYWNEGHSMTFRHPGGDTILTYWAGYPDPRNASDCAIVIRKEDKTRYVKCPNGTKAEFEADGVGIHLFDFTFLFD